MQEGGDTWNGKLEEGHRNKAKVKEQSGSCRFGEQIHSRSRVASSQIQNKAKDLVNQLEMSLNIIPSRPIYGGIDLNAPPDDEAPPIVELSLYLGANTETLLSEAPGLQRARSADHDPNISEMSHIFTTNLNLTKGGLHHMVHPCNGIVPPMEGQLPIHHRVEEEVGRLPQIEAALTQRPPDLPLPASPEMEDDPRSSKKRKVPGEVRRLAARGPILQPTVGRGGGIALGNKVESRTFRRAGLPKNHSSVVGRSGKTKDSSGCSKTVTRGQ